MINLKMHGVSGSGFPAGALLCQLCLNHFASIMLTEHAWRFPGGSAYPQAAVHQQQTRPRPRLSGRDPARGTVRGASDPKRLGERSDCCTRGSGGASTACACLPARAVSTIRGNIQARSQHDLFHVIGSSRRAIGECSARPLRTPPARPALRCSLRATCQTMVASSCAQRPHVLPDPLRTRRASDRKIPTGHTRAPLQGRARRRAR